MSSAGGRRLSRADSRVSLTSAVSGRTSTSSLASFGTRHSADSATASDELFDEAQATSALHLAAGKGNLSSLKNLVDEFGVEHVDAAGRTPLMYAVIGNKVLVC